VKLVGYVSEFTPRDNGSADLHILGQITDVSQSDKPKAPITTKVLVRIQIGSVREPTLQNFKYGDLIEVIGEFHKPRSRRNPGGFDHQLYLASRGIFATIHPASLIKVGEGGGHMLLRFSDRLRRTLEEIIDRTSPDSSDSKLNASVIKGLVIGERRAMPKAFYEKVKTSGVSHIFAVSGMNVTLVAASGFLVFTLLNLPKKCAILLSMFLVFIYSCVVGFQPSVIRASFMAIAFLFGKLIYRDLDFDFLNLICWVGLGILLFQPLWIKDAGFQLSFAATAAIVYFVPTWSRYLASTLKHRYRSALRYGSILMLTSLAAQLGTVLIIAYHFNRIYPISFISNLVVVPIADLSISLGMLSFVLGLIWTPLAIPFGHTNWALIELLLRSIYTFSQIPYAELTVCTPSLAIIALYGATVGMIAKYGFIRSQPKRAMIVGLGLTSLIIWASAISYEGKILRVTFLDVGQGDAIWIRLPDKRGLLIDSGASLPDYDCGQSVVIPFLLHERCRKLEYAFLSHPDNDHGGGLRSVFEKLKVSRFISFDYQKGEIPLYDSLCRLAQTQKIIHIVPTAGNFTMQSDKVMAQIFNHKRSNWNGSDNSAINNDSMVLKLSYENISFLFSGDIESEAEDELVENGAALSSVVLKVPHHASNTSSGDLFLDLVHPTIAVASLGAGNRFGYPSPEVVNRYKERQISLYRTDLSGAITIFTDGKRCWVKPVIRLAKKW
jgi:competence protein ComEC